MLTAVRAKRVITMVGQRPSAHNNSSYFSFPPAIDDGVIVAQNDTIVSVLSYKEFCKEFSFSPEDLGDVTLLPGVINCHTHLELSHIKGRAIFGKGFEAWIESALPLMMEPVSAAQLDAAVSEMYAAGTTHVGDVTSRSPQKIFSALERGKLTGHLFMEAFGYAYPEHFTTKDVWPESTLFLPDDVRKRHASLAGHALYSTHPTALVFAKQWCRSYERPFSVHLAEHQGEEELLVAGTGHFLEQLSRRVLPPDFVPPYMRPVAYAAELGLLDEQTLAVHCVHCSETEIALLAASGTNICLCPRSNAAIGVGKAPVAKFIRAGIPLCLGTDSLASNVDLNLWNEARMLRDDYTVPVGALLRMLTVGGAHALGITDRLGTLETGKAFRYAVLPEDVA